MQIIFERKELHGARIEVEIVDKRLVFIETTNPSGHMDAKYCPWDKLTEGQREAFESVRGELAQVVGKACALFKEVPRPEPGEEW